LLKHTLCGGPHQLTEMVHDGVATLTVPAGSLD
jgi:hypothetical protein